jgi:23S rRNA pseudouridine1911/1915/1917 synthase
MKAWDEQTPARSGEDDWGELEDADAFADGDAFDVDDASGGPRQTGAIETRMTVDVADEGTRLDKWLTEQLANTGFAVSRSQVQGWITSGYVTRAGRQAKSSEPIAAGAVYEIAVPAPPEPSLEAQDMHLDVVYEDDDVVVINKPRGLVVHPGAGNWSGTLINGLLGRGVSLSKLGGAYRPGVVHRIDKDTSGLLVVAKTDRAYHSLTSQLRAHTVERKYFAIVHGRIPHAAGIVDAPVGRDPHQRQRMAVTDSGKPAVTHFEVNEWFDRYTYVDLRLETGRTHQIRVHMAYIGHPLAGDKVYGPRHTLPIDGQALHAMTLGFVHPSSGERMHFEAPLPDDMTRLLTGLRGGLW